MGCDIHLHTEVKINGVWHHYSNPPVQRDYDLFAKMAGVRGEDCDHIKPISRPRGLPHDAAVVTRLRADRWGTQGHSHSYLDAQEIAMLEDWFREEYTSEPWYYWGWLFGGAWGDFLRCPDDMPYGFEDIRFVFWFDC